MIDTHCHLSYSPLYDEIEQVLARAEVAGVRQMITIGTRLADSVKCRDLAARYPNVHCAVGIHPHHSAEASEDELRQVCSMFTDPHVCACGEMGLDYHYDFAPRDVQRRTFETQLAAAVAANKPLVLHCREAIDESLAILKAHRKQQGVFHCFTGTADEARRVLDAGYYLGFTGIITFKNTQELRDIVAFVPADRLLLETDAPYLAPEPLRKRKVNEPSLIPHVFACVAKVRRKPLQEVIEVTTRNASGLFGLPLMR